MEKPLETPRPEMGGRPNAKARASGIAASSALMRPRIARRPVSGVVRSPQSFRLTNTAPVFEAAAPVRAL